MLRRPLPCDHFRDFPGISRTQPRPGGHPDDRDRNTDAAVGSTIVRPDKVGAATCFVKGWVVVAVTASPMQEHHFKPWVAIDPAHGDNIWNLTLVYRAWGLDHIVDRMEGWDIIQFIRYIRGAEVSLRCIKVPKGRRSTDTALSNQSGSWK